MNEYKQRLSIDKLNAWEKLGVGFFIHFGISTFDGEEFSKGDLPAEAFNPEKLDVEQWVLTAKSFGAQYAILTAKHVSGFCLWPSGHTDYSVENCPVNVDIVEAFVRLCRKHGIRPGLYYCSWDNHHLFGSKTTLHTSFELAYTTNEYRRFQTAQIEELLTNYGDLFEVWVDIPQFLPRDYRDFLYGRIAELQPDSHIVMNAGLGDGRDLPVWRCWPTDILTLERTLPGGFDPYDPVKEAEGETYYLPGELCETVGREWFFQENDRPRSDAYLFGLYLSARARGVNLLLNAGPSKDGLIPDKFASALSRLGRNIQKYDFALHGS